MFYERDQCVYFLGTDGSVGAMIIRPYPPHPWMRVVRPVESSAGTDTASLLFSLAACAAALVVAYLLA